MSFLTAHKVVQSLRDGSPLSFFLGMSGNATPLDIYLRAAAAERKQAASVRTLPFNTLAQTLRGPKSERETEVFLLFPWDFVSELDWRTGLPSSPANFENVETSAVNMRNMLRSRHGARFLYVAAEVPPLFASHSDNEQLVDLLSDLARSLNAKSLPPDMFSLTSYLASGCPIPGTNLVAAAEAIVAAAQPRIDQPKKVLVTDLDNVLWFGVIAEDGEGGISCSPQGEGYVHYLYQTLLAKLRREGVLLVCISRNDLDTALAPLRSGQMVLGEQDFVKVIANYGAKSAQIAGIAERLNLALDSFVFVDDNPIELTEVSSKLPQVTTLQFPMRADDLPLFFRTVNVLFSRTVLTAEDGERTNMYRRQLEGMPAESLAGADLTEFLRGLDMKLIIRDRSTGSHDRAVQLINKTTQFNINGQTIDDAELSGILEKGGRLLTAELQDRTGGHGEILACLISKEGTIARLVLSCRVFQRRVEYAFFSWLTKNEPPSKLSIVETARNMPAQTFLKDRSFVSKRAGLVSFNPATFAADHGEDLTLFQIVEPSHAS